MKKLFILLVVAALGISIFGLAGCGNDKPTTGAVSAPDYTNEIEGVVGVFDSGEVILFSESNGPIVLCGDMDFSGLKTGDKITIYCDDVEESYPAQTTVKEMTFHESGSIDDLPANEMATLIDMSWKMSDYKTE